MHRDKLKNTVLPQGPLLLHFGPKLPKTPWAPLFTSINGFRGGSQSQLRFLVPTCSQSLAVKELDSMVRRIWDFSWTFLWPIFLEIEGRKSANHQDRIYPHPLGDRNSDHGLSFPFPETQTMVWVSPCPNKYRVRRGLGFGLSFAWTMVWVSSREVRNPGVGVDPWALSKCFHQIFATFFAHVGETFRQTFALGFSACPENLYLAS